MRFQAARERLGMTSVWDSDDQEEVREHNRRFFDALKKKHGGGSPTKIPGFIRSLQHLWDYGYSLTDIGAFIGVSKERVRQWFNQYDGLDRHGESGGSLYRVWSDDLNCFIPASEDEIIGIAETVAEKDREQRERDRRRQRDRKRREQVMALRRIYRKTGEVPRVYDDAVVNDIGLPGSHARLWGYPDVTYTEAHDRLWAAAGFDPRPGREWSMNGDHGPERAFTDAEAEEIREEYRTTDVSQDELAERLGVSQFTIWAVVNEKHAYS